jgi:hypothetical protein
MGFLGSTPDEDGPTVMAVGTRAANEHSGTCKTLSRLDIPITTGTTLTPCRLGGTSSRQGYCGGPVTDPVSIRGRVGRHLPMEIPSCQLKISPSEGMSLGGGEWGGEVTSPSSPSSSFSSLSSPKHSGSAGVSCPHALATTRAALQSHLFCLRARRRSL